MEMSITFSLPIGNQLWGNFQNDILFSCGSLKGTLIQSGRLDIFFWMGSFGGNKRADTASKGVWAFIKMIRAKKWKRGFIDMSRFRDIGIFN